jgi:hypothetical protein
LHSNYLLLAAEASVRADGAAGTASIFFSTGSQLQNSIIIMFFCNLSAHISSPVLRSRTGSDRICYIHFDYKLNHTKFEEKIAPTHLFVSKKVWLGIK